MRAGFAQRRKMLRRSLAGVVEPAAFERAGVRPDARAEELGVDGMGQAGGTVTPAPAVTVPAPAKLTVSLRVTGVRADGYHELDAEMVTLDLADELVFADGGSGLVVDGRAGDPRRPPARRRAQPGRPCPGGLRPQRRRSASPSGSRSAAASAGARPTPPPCCAGPGAPIPALAARLGADVPFCVVGGRARVEGVGERVTPLPFEARDYLLAAPAVRGRHRGRLPRPGTRGTGTRGTATS